MLNAFRDLGHDVLEVTGYSKERLGKLRAIIEDGSLSLCDICYAENSTEPLGLTDSHHLPLRAYLEPSLFSMLTRLGIPLGVFYRDFHWLFPLYNHMASPLKRAVAKVFYRRELQLYRRYASVVYVPTIEMKKYLPQLEHCRMIPLPPGCPTHSHWEKVPSKGGRVRALYVGGILPPYELSPMADVFNACDSLDLTLVCREREISLSTLIPRLDHSKRLRIVHAFGDQLPELYAHSDIFLWLRGDCEYLDLAFPIKIAEAISYGLPILTMGKNPISKFVQENKIGWVVSSVDEAKEVVSAINTGRIDISETAERVIQIAQKNAWKDRAAQVIEDLCDVNRSRGGIENQSQ